MNRRLRRLTIASSAAFAVGLASTPANGGAMAQSRLSVWDGVYSAAQADRGRAVYASHCSRCHGEAAASRENPLSGERFADHWEARTLADLFRRIRDTMPPGASAATVDTADKRDAMAYVLRQNGFPEGTAELSAEEEALAAIRITGKNGPAPLKAGALVKVAGCLRPRGGREWELTDAAEPERTVLPAPPIDRESPAASAPATRTVALLNVFPNPAAHEGHTMRAVGFLVRNANGDAVNVVSLDLIAPSCGASASAR